MHSQSCIPDKQKAPWALKAMTNLREDSVIMILVTHIKSLEVSWAPHCVSGVGKVVFTTVFTIPKIFTKRVWHRWAGKSHEQIAMILILTHSNMCSCSLSTMLLFQTSLCTVYCQQGGTGRLHLAHNKLPIKPQRVRCHVSKQGGQKTSLQCVTCRQGGTGERGLRVGLHLVFGKIDKNLV